MVFTMAWYDNDTDILSFAQCTIRYQAQVHELQYRVERYTKIKKATGQILKTSNDITSWYKLEHNTPIGTCAAYIYNLIHPKKTA